MPKWRLSKTSGDFKSVATRLERSESKARFEVKLGKLANPKMEIK